MTVLWTYDARPVGDYDASLLTKAHPNGSRTFIAPQEEGLYHVKLVRGDTQELASTSFRVTAATRLPSLEHTSAEGSAEPAQKERTKRASYTSGKTITRQESPHSVMDLQ